tara:strand:+ start:830 stop:1273 length:444 start_codon:yes stop_codon:yes gene_type:complete
MAPSIYIYDCKETYEKMYKDFQDDPMRESPLLDLYVNKDKLYVITNTNMHKEQPRMEKTIVHFRNGDLGKWAKEDDKLVKYNTLRFNKKKNCIEFFPRFLRKPLLSLRIGRFYGELEKSKCGIDYSLRYYDLMMDRINLVLETDDGV